MDTEEKFPQKFFDLADDWLLTVTNDFKFYNKVYPRVRDHLMGKNCVPSRSGKNFNEWVYGMLSRAQAQIPCEELKLAWYRLAKWRQDSHISYYWAILCLHWEEESLHEAVNKTQAINIRSRTDELNAVIATISNTAFKTQPTIGPLETTDWGLYENFFTGVATELSKYMHANQHIYNLPSQATEQPMEPNMATYQFTSTSEITTVRFLLGKPVEEVTDNELIATIKALKGDRTALVGSGLASTRNVSQKIRALDERIAALIEELDADYRVGAEVSDGDE